MKILYVENHPDFISAVKREFLKGHNIDVVPTVKEATSKTKHCYDLVLCDFDLDDGKGSDFIEYFRSCGFETPIIAVSSHDHGNQRMLEVGANASCKKLDFRNINAVIDQVIK